MLLSLATLCTEAIIISIAACFKVQQRETFTTRQESRGLPQGVFEQPDLATCSTVSIAVAFCLLTPLSSVTALPPVFGSFRRGAHIPLWLSAESAPGAAAFEGGCGSVAWHSTGCSSAQRQYWGEILQRLSWHNRLLFAYSAGTSTCLTFEAARAFPCGANGRAWSEVCLGSFCCRGPHDMHG